MTPQYKFDPNEVTALRRSLEAPLETARLETASLAIELSIGECIVKLLDALATSTVNIPASMDMPATSRPNNSPDEIKAILAATRRIEDKLDQWGQQSYVAAARWGVGALTATAPTRTDPQPPAQE